MVGMVGTYVYVIISLISIEEIHRIVVSTVTLCFRVIGDNNAPSTSTSSSSSFSLCRCRVSRWMDGFHFISYLSHIVFFFEFENSKTINRE